MTPTTLSILPLNGTKTHPLKPGSILVLNKLMRDPQPRQEINAGVVDRLLREALAESVQLPSPYKSHNGRLIEFLQITAAGRDALAAVGARRPA